MTSSLIRLAGLIAALAVVPATVRAQSTAPRAQPAPMQPGAPGYPTAAYPGAYQPGVGFPQQERMSVVDPDKKLSAGDEVTVEIVEDREGGLARVVTATGELDVPPLGR